MAPPRTFLLNFSAVPVTVLAVLIYSFLFLAVFVTDETSDVSRDQEGLNVDRALEDLHVITYRPHPVLSHAHDDAHAYVFFRLSALASNSSYVHVSNDVQSSASYVTGTTGSYYESTNILVKVDGTDPQTLNDGVLFSAHLDSISTGPGATDDAIGIVTMMQLVEYLAHPERRPRKTAVFLFNSGEEDGLNGSHMFLEHPWANLTSEFINLEGAGSGGRPLVFRSSTLGSVRSFASGSIDHPHGNVLCHDAFDIGVLRSRTDYQVFEKGLQGIVPGLEGTDYSFYRDRAVYHTPRDSIAQLGTEELRKSVWAMMDGARGAGLALLNEDKSSDDGNKAVYFDILGRSFVVFPLRYLLTGNIVLLVFGPVSLLALLVWVVTVVDRHTNAGARASHTTTISRVGAVLVAMMSWGRFWGALGTTVLGQALLVNAFVQISPFAIYSYATTILLSSLSLTYITLVLPLQASQHYYKTYPAQSQKLAVLLSLFLVTWEGLLLSTIAVGKYSVGGVYFVTALYLSVWSAAGVGLGEAAWRAGNASEAEREREVFDLMGETGLVGGPVVQRTNVRSEVYDGPVLVDAQEVEVEGTDAVGEDVVVTEHTPLIHRAGESLDRRGSNGRGAPREAVKTHIEENAWWIGQMVLLIPFPVILISQLQLLLTHSLRHSLADGNSPLPVYAGIAFFSTLIGLPITPFAHKLHCDLTRLMIIVFTISTLYALLAFPFTQEYPLKIFFQQKLFMELPSPAHPYGQVSHATTLLTGPAGYVNNTIIPSLPNSLGKPLDCHVDNTSRAGLLMCGWDSTDLLPSPGGLRTIMNHPNASKDLHPDAVHSDDWMTVHLSRRGTHNATIAIAGHNTRACRIQFDDPISYYRVRTTDAGNDPLPPPMKKYDFQPGYEITSEGVTDLPLWSRTWGQEFIVDIGWNVSTTARSGGMLKGTVGCAWAEYASASAGAGWAGASGTIPALEEVVRFLPLWAAPIKWTYGLVETEARFAV
ncbi:hypothetical protein EIP91_011961 [Steccherinum ochraceum]|uniref:Peptide hydrolase n=1 Tax=Steccherinum ochraceum TaxID=92696 RepID=A0A4R0RNX1_9APHY|nr:hypothetical protein EIP91_011961 [Steccherinum ochraceum]